MELEVVEIRIKENSIDFWNEDIEKTTVNNCCYSEKLINLVAELKLELQKYEES